MFEAVSFNGAEWFILFADLYHRRRSRVTPDGFRFTKEVAQFSGFHKFCEHFPYDFVEKKRSERESGLSMAYVAISNVRDAFRNAVNRAIKKIEKWDKPLAEHLKASIKQGNEVVYRPGRPIAWDVRPIVNA